MSRGSVAVIDPLLCPRLEKAPSLNLSSARCIPPAWTAELCFSEAEVAFRLIAVTGARQRDSGKIGADISAKPHGSSGRQVDGKRPPPL